MGGGNSKSTSEVSQKYDTTIITKDDLELLNSNINESVVNTIINQASNCSASISGIQNVKLANIKTTGDLYLNTKQQQTSNITFDCLQISSFKNNIANDMLNKIIDTFNSNYKTEVIDKLETIASGKASSGFGSSIFSGDTVTNSKTNVDYKFSNITDIHKNIQNIIKNSIVTNLNLDDVQNCISSIKQNQEVAMTNLDVGGKVIVIVDQNQSAQILSKCIQQRNIANDITSKIINDLELTVKTETEIKKQTESKAVAESVSESKGIFESVGDGIKKTVSSITDPINKFFDGLFGGGGSGSWMTYIVLIICCLSIILIIGGGYYYMTMKGGNLNNNQIQTMTIK